jgi:hypothetical protein
MGERVFGGGVKGAVEADEAAEGAGGEDKGAQDDEVFGQGFDLVTCLAGAAHEAAQAADIRIEAEPVKVEVPQVAVGKAAGVEAMFVGVAVAGLAAALAFWVGWEIGSYTSVLDCWLMMAAPGRGDSWISPYFYYSTFVLLLQVKWEAVRELKGWRRRVKEKK